MADQSFSASFTELLATARGHFIWPEDAVLYRLPPERELLADKARRLCFQTYLQLCKLSYSCNISANADAMSPHNTAPFLTVRIGAHLTIFAEFEKLVLFLEAQSLGLDSRLQSVERADNAAFISLIRGKIAPAEEHQTWSNTENVNQHTKKVCGRGVAWPLSRFLPWLRQAEFIWDHWELFRAEEDAILLQFEQACNALQARLGTSDTFFASGPSTLDVLAFSHMQAILTTPLPSGELCSVARQYQSLSQFCQTLITTQDLQFSQTL